MEIDQAVQIVYTLAVVHMFTRREKEAVRVVHDWLVRVSPGGWDENEENEKEGD
mgnify:CR=1 FL=1